MQRTTGASAWSAYRTVMGTLVGKKSASAAPPSSRWCELPRLTERRDQFLVRDLYRVEQAAP
jgi:hypothetical protein